MYFRYVNSKGEVRSPKRYCFPYSVISQIFITGFGWNFSLLTEGDEQFVENRAYFCAGAFLETKMELPDKTRQKPREASTPSKDPRLLSPYHQK